MNRSENDRRTIGGLYVLAFTPEVLEPNALRTLSQVAIEMLKAKDSTFTQLFEETLRTNTSIEIADVEYVASMHTPQTMQATLAGWLRNQYQVMFDPVVGENFFPHGMRDDQGREKIVLFYFQLRF